MIEERKSEVTKNAPDEIDNHREKVETLKFHNQKCVRERESSMKFKNEISKMCKLYRFYEEKENRY